MESSSPLRHSDFENRYHLVKNSIESAIESIESIESANFNREWASGMGTIAQAETPI